MLIIGNRIGIYSKPVKISASPSSSGTEITTEDGKTITTEAGDILIRE